MGFQYLGLKPIITVPICAAILILIVLTGSFRYWEPALFQEPQRVLASG
jgi:Mn2+/Fe2+ NRAMP family transporter